MSTRSHQMREVATAQAATAIVYRGSWSKPESKPQSLNLGCFDRATGLQGSP